MQKTAAQLLVDCLLVNGFQRAFGVPGESYLDLLDAMHGSPLDYVVCRQEGGAAMAAAAHGQLTAQPGLCMVTRGPGATNASAGLHLAYQGGLPMLVLIGQVPRHEHFRDTFQELDYDNFYSEVTKWTREIWDADRIPEYVARAVSVARSGRPGPVALALPEDMLADMTGAEPVVAADPPVTKLDEAVVSELTDMLAAAERPYMVVGGIGWTPEASAALAEFAATNQVPVGFSFRAQDCLDNAHECACGPVGIGGDPNQVKHFDEADLIIAVGTRIGDGTTKLSDALTNRDSDRKLIHLHPGPDELGRVVQPDLSATVLPSQAMLALGSVVTQVSNERRAWREKARSVYETFSTPKDGKAGYLGRIVQTMQSELPPSAILCNGAGNFAMWLHRYFRYQQNATALGPVSGSMGYDVPAAMAAAMERPNDPAIAWAGDGSFMMTGQELASAVQRKLNVTVVVIDNGMFGTIRLHQERRFPGRVSGTDMINPDFAALARSYGAHGETASSVDEFRQALRNCLAAEGPGLIHLPVDPNVLLPEFVIDSAE